MKKAWKAEKLITGHSEAPGWVWKASTAVTFVISALTPLGWEKPRPFLLHLIMHLTKLRQIEVQIERYLTVEDAKISAEKVFKELTKQ